MLMITEDLHLITVREYHSMEIETKTELINGIIYDVSPKGNEHKHVVRMLDRILTAALSDRYYVQPQDELIVDGWDGKNAPEPDIAIVDSEIVGGAFGPDTHAIIEVCNTTYRRDRVKMGIYVAAGIPAFIVNIVTRAVEEYRDAADLDAVRGRVHTERFEPLPGVVVELARLWMPDPAQRPTEPSR
jgi:Uma2 family endonuclease